MASHNSNTYNIICFGFLPWSNMWKRNQSMMAELAKFDFIHRVIFVDPLVSIRRLLSWKNNNFHNNNADMSLKFFPFKLNSKIWKYTPIHFLPYRINRTLFERIETNLMINIIKQLNSKKPHILFMNCPNIVLPNLLDELLKKAELSIFDFSDDFAELALNNNIKELWKTNMIKYAQAADIVLTVNDHLKNKYNFLNSNIHVIRNATNYHNFDRQTYTSIPYLEKLKSTGKPIIGYSGSATIFRVDFDLLTISFKERPDWHFVFIGHTDPYFTGICSKYDNVHLIPPVDYQILPNYLRYFDVAIVPFMINEHTKGNDLLKFHDYLAMGKAVVSTETSGAQDLKDLIRIAHTSTDFLREIEEALTDYSSEVISRRKNIALGNSWCYRIEDVTKLMINHLR